jgi:hypothetical protein
MSINELNSGVGSWSQFIRLKEAARERGFGQNANAKGASGAGGGTAKFSEILSSKGGNNVYLDPKVKTLQDTLAAVRAKDVPAKGKMFDTYA